MQAAPRLQGRGEKWRSRARISALALDPRPTRSATPTTATTPVLGRACGVPRWWRYSVGSTKAAPVARSKAPASWHTRASQRYFPARCCNPDGLIATARCLGATGSAARHAGPRVGSRLAVPGPDRPPQPNPKDRLYPLVRAPVGAVDSLVFGRFHDVPNTKWRPSQSGWLPKRPAITPPRGDVAATLAFSAQSIAHTSDSHNVLIPQFSAQIMHVDFHRIAGDFLIPTIETIL